MLFTIDRKGNFTHYATDGPELLALDRAQVIGKPYVEVAGPYPAFLAQIERALAGESFTAALDLDGDSVEVSYHALVTPTGKRNGAIGITSARRSRASHTSESYHELLDHLSEICFVIDRDWRYTSVNRAALAVVHKELDHFTGKSVSEFFPDADTLPGLNAYRQAMHSGEPRSFLADWLPLPDCPASSYEVTVSPTPFGLICLARDASERARAEMALKESEARYHAIFEESRDAIFVTTLDGKIVEFNQAALDLFELSRSDLARISVEELYADPADREVYRRVMNRDGLVRDFPVTLRRAGGETMDCLISATIWRSPDGEVQGYQGIIRDITAQKRAAEAVRESEARFRAVFEGTALGVAMLDLEGRPMAANPALQEMLHYSENQLRDLTLLNFGHPEDVATGWGQFKLLAQGQQDHFQTELRLMTSAGDSVWVAMVVSTIRELGGKPLYAIAVIEDISDRKQAENALRESEERYRRLVEFSPEPMAVHIAGKLVYLNPACARMLGAQNPDELIGQPVLTFVHPDYHEAVVQRIHETQEAMHEVPLIHEKFIRLDGEIIDVEVVAIPIVYHGQHGTQVIMRDITERVRAEAGERALFEALRRTSAALNSTLELDEVLSWILSSVGQVVPHEAATIMLVEDNMVRVVGQHGYYERGAGDEIATFHRELQSIKTLKLMAETLQPLIIDDVNESDLWTYVQPSRWIRSHLSAPVCMDNAVIGFINLDSPRPGFFSKAHAERLRTFADQAATAIKNARLYADLKRYAVELEARNRDLDAFGDMVAHDLKAPLHVILGYASLIMSDFKNEISEEIMGYMKFVADYAAKLDTMIESMLLLARVKNVDVQVAPLDVGAVTREAARRFEKVVAEGKIRLEIADELPHALGHAPWLEEVFANLIENAIKYLGKDNTKPRISIRGKQADDGMVRYEVKDNGIGIPEESLPEVFEMFSRVRHSGGPKGSGLGLAIVKRMVVKMNGKVGVDSTPGKGSTFWFTLPGV